MSTFLPALTALLPGVDEVHFWEINSDLDIAERDLNEVIAEATKARDALRNARKATTKDHANTFLGEAFAIAANPGYSGTAVSKLESANARLQSARTSVRIIDRFSVEA